MINPPMSPSCAETPRISRGAIRWLLPAALLALTPKCVMCVLAYIGAGATLGIGGPEWCSLEGDGSFPWMTMLAWAGGTGVFAVLGVLAISRRVRDRI
jgi:hypothetical protein